MSLAPAITEILFAVGAGNRVVGVTTFCDFPAEARTLPKVGGYVNPSIESIVALHPDLVLISPAVGNRDAASALERAGLRLEVVHAETLAETFVAIEQIARACHVESRGREVAGEVRRRVDEVAALAGRLPKVRALFCLQLDPLIAAGRGTLPSELLELAGGINVVSADRYPRLGIETVLAEAPEVIVQSRMDAAEPEQQRGALEFWGRWPTVPAVHDGRVFVIDGTTALRAGPRIADAIELLARLLHPEAVGAGVSR